MNVVHNYLEWSEAFRKAAGNVARMRELRSEIFHQTVEIVKSGGYALSGSRIAVDNSEIAKKSEFYDARISLGASASGQTSETRFSVVEADCLETAEMLLKAGFSPCVLNMASRRNPGGGVLNGAGAQEENIFRRSNIMASLYQYADYAAQYGLSKSAKQYPLDASCGGIYSPDVTVFRSSEHTGYRLLNTPYQVAVVSVAAMNRPDLVRIDGRYRIADHHIEPTKEKMRTILRIAGKHGHKALVLSAFGCGAFCNPPEHVALLFREVFAESEFKRLFTLVVFAIIDDRNTRKSHNPQGNVLPFQEVFDL